MIARLQCYLALVITISSAKKKEKKLSEFDLLWQNFLDPCMKCSASLRIYKVPSEPGLQALSHTQGIDTPLDTCADLEGFFFISQHRNISGP